MEVLKFMHVCVAVPDLDKALDFYCNTLGMKSDFQTDNDEADGLLLGFDQEKIHLRAHHVIAASADPAAATEINLVEYTDPKTIIGSGPCSIMNQVGLTRLALMVDDLREVMDAVEKYEGTEIICEPRDLIIKEPDATYVMTWSSFKDPFGIFVTLAQPPRPQE